jgi:hypothetical protein
MNAQQLINETPTEESFDYSVFFKSLSKHNNDDRGDEIVGLPQNDSQFECQTLQSSDLLSNLPINNIKNKSVEFGDAFRDLGIEVL